MSEENRSTTEPKQTEVEKQTETPEDKKTSDKVGRLMERIGTSETTEINTIQYT